MIWQFPLVIVCKAASFIFLILINDYLGEEELLKLDQKEESVAPHILPWQESFSELVKLHHKFA